jgi:hypothetical protein
MLQILAGRHLFNGEVHRVPAAWDQLGRPRRRHHRRLAILLNPEFRLQSELLVNAGFERDTTGWIRAPGPLQVTAGGVVLLSPGSLLAQAVPITVTSVE